MRTIFAIAEIEKRGSEYNMFFFYYIVAVHIPLSIVDWMICSEPVDLAWYYVYAYCSFGISRAKKAAQQSAIIIYLRCR